MENQQILSCLPDEIPISMINFVGTHDSATAFVSLEKISRCQDLTIAEQLRLGVRFLDIRLFNFMDKFYLVHSQADCFTDKTKKTKLKFEAVLSDCLDFLRDNPGETIIMSVKKDRGAITQQLFFKNFYNRYIRGNEDVWYLENRIPVLGQCRGKIVLMRRCRKYKAFEDKKMCGLDFSVWRDQASSSKFNPLPVELSENQHATVQDRYRLAPENKWKKCAQPFLSRCVPSRSHVCLHFLSSCGGSGVPRQCAGTVNGYFEDFALQSGPTGWIILDFPTKELCSKIYERNYQFYKIK